MGWTFQHKPRDISPADFIRSQETEFFARYVIKTVTANNAVFALVRVTPESEHYANFASIYEANANGEIFTISLWMYQLCRDAYNFGTKSMDETAGPSVNGPPSLIYLASPIKPGAEDGSRKWASDWRARSLNAAIAKGITAKVKRQISEGTRVSLPSPVKFSNGIALSDFVATYIKRRGRNVLAFRPVEGFGLYRLPAHALATATLT